MFFPPQFSKYHRVRFHANEIVEIYFHPRFEFEFTGWNTDGIVTFSVQRGYNKYKFQLSFIGKRSESVFGKARFIMDTILNTPGVDENNLNTMHYS